MSAHDLDPGRKAASVLSEREKPRNHKNLGLPKQNNTLVQTPGRRINIEALM